MFTILLPISIALNIFGELSKIFSSILALLFQASAKERIFILLTVVRAVSADEKNADISNNKIITSIIRLVSGPNWKITPLIINKI